MGRFAVGAPGGLAGAGKRPGALEDGAAVGGANGQQQFVDPEFARRGPIPEPTGFALSSDASNQWRGNLEDMTPTSMMNLIIFLEPKALLFAPRS